MSSRMDKAQPYSGGTHSLVILSSYSWSQLNKKPLFSQVLKIMFTSVSHTQLTNTDIIAFMKYEEPKNIVKILSIIAFDDNYYVWYQQGQKLVV